MTAIRTPRSPGRRDVLRGGLGLLAGAAVVGAAGCSDGSGASDGSGTVAIATGYGLSYASLTVVEARGWLAEALPDRTVEWQVLSGARRAGTACSRAASRRAPAAWRPSSRHATAASRGRSSPA
ncbi:hypothetical protein HFP72_06130 [Nocardiopsis sp. ARC36]